MAITIKQLNVSPNQKVNISTHIPFGKVLSEIDLWKNLSDVYENYKVLEVQAKDNTLVIWAKKPAQKKEKEGE